MRKFWLFQKIDENINRTVYWIAFLGLVSAAMSWAATYITPLYQYGFGAVVFAGVGAACVIALVVSCILVAWRYFHPLPKQPTRPSEGQGEPTLDNVLSRRLIEIDQDITQNKANIEQLRAETDKLKERAESDRQQIGFAIDMLSTALRARDAESKVKEADQIIMSISKRLLNEAYPDESAWAADYAAWEAAIKRIDSIISEWTQRNKPFLDIRLRDFELGAPALPSQSNIKSDANVMHYKTVWLVQRRYANERENIFIFFTSKTRELP